MIPGRPERPSESARPTATGKGDFSDGTEVGRPSRTFIIPREIAADADRKAVLDERDLPAIASAYIDHVLANHPDTRQRGKKPDSRRLPPRITTSAAGDGTPMAPLNLTHPDDPVDITVRLTPREIAMINDVLVEKAEWARLHADPLGPDSDYTSLAEIATRITCAWYKTQAVAAGYTASGVLT